MHQRKSNEAAIELARSDAEVTDNFPLPTSSTSLLTVADPGRSSNRLRFLNAWDGLFWLGTVGHDLHISFSWLTGGEFSQDQSWAPASKHGRLADQEIAVALLVTPL